MEPRSLHEAPQMHTVHCCVFTEHSYCMYTELDGEKHKIKSFALLLCSTVYIYASCTLASVLQEGKQTHPFHQE